MTTHMGTREKLLSEVIRGRRSTGRFKPDPVLQEDLDRILRAGLEAPSGYNLQPWRFVVVRDAQQRKKLQEAAMNQPKVGEAPVVIVACGDPQGWKDRDLEDMLKLAAQNGYGGPEQHAQVRKTVTGFLSAAPGDAGGFGPDMAVWVNRHVMIAFTHLMLAAEAYGYDTAPMEGFFESKVRQVLGIPERVRVVALLAIGRREGADKPYGGRFPPERVFHFDRWKD